MRISYLIFLTAFFAHSVFSQVFIPFSEVSPTKHSKEIGTSLRSHLWDNGNNNAVISQSTNLQRLDSIRVVGYDSISAGFVDFIKAYYVYDFKGQMTEWWLLFKENNKWDTGWVQMATYDIHGNITSLIEMNWDSAAQGLVNTTNRLRTYNQWNQVVSSTDQYWNGFQWMDGYRTDYVYDGQRRLSMDYTLFKNGSTWDSIFRNTYSYGPNQKMVLAVEELFIAGSPNMWEKLAKYEFTYQTNTALKDVTYSGWDVGMGQYMPYWRDVYTFDANGNNTETEYLDYYNGQFTPYGKEARMFNTALGRNDLIIPQTEFYFFDEFTVPVNQVTGFEGYEYFGGQHNKTEIATYHYSTQSVNLALEESDLKNPFLFPNPSKGALKVSLPITLKSANLEVYSMEGKLVFSEWVENGQELFLNYLQDGIYFYSIAYKDKVYEGKFIKVD